MKIVLKVLNYVIMAISLAASVLLFAMPSFSFNSNVALDVVAFSKFVPETQYSQYINITDSLGTDTIHVGVKFSLNAGQVAKAMGGNRDRINEMIISKNVDDIVATLHEPVDLITDFSLRSVIKSTVKAEIEKQIEANKKPEWGSSSVQDILDECGIDDEYFTNFAYRLYDATNEDNANIDSVNFVLYEQIDEALTKAEKNGLGGVVNPGYVESTKEAVKTNLAKVLTDLKLLDEKGNIVKLKDICYYYLSLYLNSGLKDKVKDPASLERKSDETIPQYSDRLLSIFVLTQTPDFFYQLVGWVSIGLFIGLFLFTGIWLFLLGFTIYRVFIKKKPTFFGPWFWAVGSLQLVLGIGLTIVGKFILPTVKFSKYNIPLKQVILAPRTYALIPSILFIVCGFIAIGYFVIKLFVKKEEKSQGGTDNEKE